MSLWKWSRTAASNSTADNSINWAEGQAPSTVNDSARGMMAAVAKYRDDVAGAITTGGTSTAYTVSSFQVFDTLAHMDGACIAFVPHTTNGDTVTLNVDSLGAKPLRQAPSVDLVAGMIVEGTPYMATYNNSNSEWILKGFFGNPYNVPIGGGLPYYGTTVPNSCFAFPFGQAISRTTYATCFSALGTAYGSGDGSTTFNLPDVRGRVEVGKDNMGGSAASRVTSGGSGIAGTTLGATGGSETHTLTIAQLPSHDHGGATGAGGTHSHTYSKPGVGGVYDSGGGNIGPGLVSDDTSTAPNHTHSITAQGGGGAHNNMPPSIVVNKLIRII